MHLSYTVDGNMMHFAAVSAAAATDYISVGFSDTLDMQGDTVDGQGFDMKIYSRTMSGHPTPKVMSGEYITNQKLQYVDGMIVMQYSRTLAAPLSGSYIQSSAAPLKMVFAIGAGPYKKHSKWWVSTLPFTAQAAPFTPSLVDIAPGTFAAPVATIPPAIPTTGMVMTTGVAVSQMTTGAGVSQYSVIAPTAIPTMDHMAHTLAPKVPVAQEQSKYTAAATTASVSVLTILSLILSVITLFI